MIIKLTQNKETIIDDADIEVIKGWSWHVVRRWENLWYARGYRNGKWIYMHRLLLPEASIVDHIDHDGLNNRRINLRSCTQSSNVRNTGLQRNNTSGYRGVRLHPRWGWQAYTKRLGKQIHLGWHETPEMAAFARDAWTVRNCDKYAKLNFPPVLNPLLVSP